MNELLTTGQMIDRLNVWQMAELEEKAQIPEIYGRSYKRVTKNRMGDIKWCRDDGRIEEPEPLLLYGHTVNWKWRILPNYVSFEEAMKALKEGKTVRCHPEWRSGALSHEIKSTDAGFKAIKFLDISEEGLMTLYFESKWTIEEDNNG